MYPRRRGVIAPPPGGGGLRPTSSPQRGYVRAEPRDSSRVDHTNRVNHILSQAPSASHFRLWRSGLDA